MKKIFTILSIAALSILASSCVHKGDMNLDPIPDIDFELTCVDGFNYTLTNKTQGATNVSWEILSYASGSKEVVLSGSGDTWNFTFPKKGSYWIGMTATHNGYEQTIYTSKYVDKSSAVKLDDDSFDDWSAIDVSMIGRNLNTPEADREGPCAFVNGKFDYDGENVYFYVVVDSNYDSRPMGLMPNGRGGNEFIILLNTDGDLSTTGSTQADEGYEYLVEFKFWEGDSEVCFVGTTDDYDGWDSLSDAEQNTLCPSFKFGTTKKIGENYYFEFGLDRKILGITGDAFGCQYQITKSWDTCDYLWSNDKDTEIIFPL